MPGFIGIDGWWWLYFDIAELSNVSESHDLLCHDYARTEHHSHRHKMPAYARSSTGGLRARVIIKICAPQQTRCVLKIQRLGI